MKKSNNHLVIFVAKQIMSKISQRCAEEVRPIPTMFTEELTKLRDNEWNGKKAISVAKDQLARMCRLIICYIFLKCFKFRILRAILFVYIYFIIIVYA